MIITILQKLKSYKSIILNHRWADIELIHDKTYGHDKLSTGVGWKIKYLFQIEYNIWFYSTNW
jgi:hypothetical protein